MRQPKITIAYLTFRKNPRFEWFALSLKREFESNVFDPADAQIVVIDGRLWYDDARHAQMIAAAAERIQFEHHPPKPTIWQGPSRRTSRDFFAAANARNTALMSTLAPHVAFVDDLSWLSPGWLAAHLQAAESGYVLAGMTFKCKNIQVNENGDVKFDLFSPGNDSRWVQMTDAFQACPGAWLYGGTFSVPLSAALAVNGQDEIHDSIGGEDYDFGIRLERVGVPMRISKTCMTIEDEDAHHAEAPMIRLDKSWPGEDGPYSSNFLLARLLRETSRVHAVGNRYNLADERARVLAGGSLPLPPADVMRHWVDGQPLSEL